MKSRIWLLGFLFAFCMAGADADKKPRSPAGRAAIEKFEAVEVKAEAAYRIMVSEALKTEIRELEAARQSAVRSDALDEAMRIMSTKTLAETSLANVSRPKSSAANADFSGRWRVSYTNDHDRDYDVKPDGKVIFVDENRTGEIVDGIVDLADGTLERWTIAGDRVMVEHFNPSKLIREGRAHLMGIGNRLK